MDKRIIFFLFLFSSLPLFSFPEDKLRRINSHLIIGDTQSAVAESRSCVQQFPEDPLAYECLIKSYAAAGEEKLMMETWEIAHSKFPEMAMKRELLEEMCWGVLKKGGRAYGATTRLISIIGAALAQDIQAVPTLLAGMRDPSSRLRSVSVQMAALYGDAPLRKQLISMFREEKVQEVYFQVLEAIGKLKMNELLPELMQIIESKKASPEEKKIAIQTIANCQDDVSSEEIVLLAKSKKAHLRMLACECISRFCRGEHTDLLCTLIDDANPEVRTAALKAVGLSRFKGKEILCAVEKASMSLDPNVGITAGWVLLLIDQEKGEKILKQWLSHEKGEVRALAASAIGAAGSYGVALALREIETIEDTYVCVNLACALIRQRAACEKACVILENFLTAHKELIMAEQSVHSLFQPIVRSTLTHHPAIPNYPEVMNQTVRLELLNLLAMLDYPGTYDIIKRFLKEKNWKITGLAAELLLEEGDEAALDHVRLLLTDSDREIRTEAALLLAMWGREKTALPSLLEAYDGADRMLKIKILEALGRIGDRTTIPFLIQRLKEPASTIRLIAAAVLIQTLNH